MNEKNVAYLEDNLKYLGFGSSLNADLEKNIAQRFPEFVLRLQTEINRQPFSASLYFRKGDQSDVYFFNRWDAELKNDVGRLQQTFYVNKGQGVTLKEGFNLLEGRAVHKELQNQEGQKYQAWLQLDLKERDPNGNYKLQQYHSNYGFDLEKKLAEFPIKELASPEQKDMLLRSLQKGNIARVTLEGKGAVEKVALEAAPRFKSLNFYEAGGRRITQQAIFERLGNSLGSNKALGQEQGQKHASAPGQSVDQGKKKNASEVTQVGKGSGGKAISREKSFFIDNAISDNDGNCGVMGVDLVTKADLQAFRVELLHDLRELLGRTQSEKSWLRNREVCRLLGISPSTLQRLRIAGKLKASKVGGIHYYPASEIERLLSGR